MQCFLGCSSLLLYVLSAINGLITQRSVVQIHPPQPNLPFGFNGLSQSHNWLGGSNTQLPSPNFRISLRTVLRNPCEGHPFRHFRPTSALQLGITIWVGHAAAARLRIAGAFLRLLYGFRFLGTVSPVSKHPPSRRNRVRMRVNPALVVPSNSAASPLVPVARIAPIAG